MPVLLLDLDNTLIDRDVAFRRAVAAFLRENDLPRVDLDWVMTEDAGGYAPRERLYAAMRSRWGHAVPPERVEGLLAGGAMDHVRPDPTIDTALRTAIERGWTPVVITNGGSAQQRGKLRASGLDRLVAGWVISEEVGSETRSGNVPRGCPGRTDIAGWRLDDRRQRDARHRRRRCGRNSQHLVGARQGLARGRRRAVTDRDRRLAAGSGRAAAPSTVLIRAITSMAVQRRTPVPGWDRPLPGRCPANGRAADRALSVVLDNTRRTLGADPALVSDTGPKRTRVR